MVKEIQTTVTYINDEDLHYADREESLDKINITSLKVKSIAKKSHVLIFKRGMEYKVLKSKY